MSTYKECTIGSNAEYNYLYKNKQTWDGFFETEFGGTDIYCTGEPYILGGPCNYNPNGGFGSQMSSVKNNTNRLLILYKSQGIPNSNDHYDQGLIILPNSQISVFDSNWNDTVQCSNLDGEIFTADKFIQVIGNDSAITGTYQTNFFLDSSLTTLTSDQKVNLAKNVYHDNCNNAYTKYNISQANTVFDYLQLTTCLYQADSALVENTLISPSAGWDSVTPMNRFVSSAYNPNSTNPPSINNWLSSGSTDYLTNANCIAKVNEFVMNNWNSDVTLALLNSTVTLWGAGVITSGLTAGQSFLSNLAGGANGICSGSELVTTNGNCAIYCGTGTGNNNNEHLCDQAVNTFCSNPSNKQAYPTLCGCWIPFDFGPDVPAYIQDFSNQNPACANPHCSALSYHLQAWTMGCDVNILSCIETANITVSNGGTVNGNISLNQSEVCTSSYEKMGGYTSTASATSSTITSNISSNTIGSSTPIIVTVSMFSAQGTPVPNVAVQLTGLNEFITCTPTSCLTTSTGPNIIPLPPCTAVFTLTSTQACSNLQIGAQDTTDQITLTTTNNTGTIPTTIPITFVEPSMSSSSCTITANETSVAASKSITITVTILSSSGMPIPNQTIELTHLLNTVTCTPISAITDNTGVVSFVLTSTNTGGSMNVGCLNVSENALLSTTIPITFVPSLFNLSMSEMIVIFLIFLITTLFFVFLYFHRKKNVIASSISSPPVTIIKPNTT